jgi:uncharacterized membrane protein YhiD involved in acid resistance
MDKIELHLLQKTIMTLKKKLFKAESNHKQPSYLIKMERRKNQVQEVNQKHKNQKVNHRWNIEEKFKKMHQK